jgi:suppressor for copper-sensitivity B
VMGAAIGWTHQQPVPVVFLIFCAMGLGMAAPYLVLAAFPRLINWLPKPGDWMVRFKEFAGFVLLGSVIFLINGTDTNYRIPILVMLLGVALGLWMIGNLYDTNSLIRRKMTVRVAAFALTGLLCWFGYRLAGESKHTLPWEPFSDAGITSLLKENKTVLVDFTADWCANCRWNESVALNTEETRKLVERNGVIALRADFTKQPPELQRWLAKFRQDGVPLTAIFPAGRQNEPIVITGIYTQGTLLEKLQEALEHPSATARSDAASTAVR